MPRIFLAALVLCIFAAALPARAETACAFPDAPQVLMEEGDPHEIGSRLLQVWEVGDDPVFWSPTVPDDAAYRDFRRQVDALGIETDPVRLLEASPTANNLIVIDNADDWIGPAFCLEMLLYAHQHARLDTFAAPTEFGAIVLRSSDEDRLRIYYFTVNQDGLGNMDTIVEPVLEDRAEGWTVQVALHSHVFHPGQPMIDGILAPSEPDADFHVRLHEVTGLREAWITNGIDTVRMPADSFDRFERPAPGDGPANRAE